MSKGEELYAKWQSVAQISSPWGQHGPNYQQNWEDLASLIEGDKQPAKATRPELECTLNFSVPAVISLVSMARCHATKPEADTVAVKLGTGFTANAAEEPVIRGLKVEFECPRPMVAGLNQGEEYQVSLRRAK